MYIIKECKKMIGLGTWTGDIETSMISGNAIVEITDNNGEYNFSVTVPSLKKLPNFRVYNIKENGNSLSGKAEIDLVGKMVSEGTTPRQLTDLIGSLCDLTSGSGDKGTPIVLIQGYFDNYTTE
jgi:hypothetical protein